MVTYQPRLTRGYLSFIYISKIMFLFLVALGFELRVLHLLGRCSTISIMPQPKNMSYTNDTYMDAMILINVDYAQVMLSHLNTHNT
jgi:uncharacterized paraquat-inducible protein A